MIRKEEEQKASGDNENSHRLFVLFGNREYQLTKPVQVIAVRGSSINSRNGSICRVSQNRHAIAAPFFFLVGQILDRRKSIFPRMISGDTNIAR